MMTISTKGNDTITMSNCLQALQQVIETERALAAQTTAESQMMSTAEAEPAIKPEIVE
jgi:hypothetical protein